MVVAIPIPGEVCKRVLSSWVWEVCFVPGRGVKVTFHKHFVPYVTVIYPGTTMADYTAFVNAPSKGRHIHAFYIHRPYVLA